MGHQICFSVVKTTMFRDENKIDILLKYPRSRIFIRKLRFSVVLFCGWKVWRCSSFSSVSSLAWFVVVECRENCSSFSMSWKDFFFLHDCSIRILQFLLHDNEISLLPTFMLFLFPCPRRKSVILSSFWKVADVFKLNDEKRSHFLIDEIFQVAMFLQWNLIVEHPKIF